MGLGTDGRTPGYPISQRADFFEAEVGLETTIRRPIINTRDEPHSVADKYRRLHVIIGDANLSEVSIFLKMGTTAVVLSMIEQGEAPDVQLADPVQALQAISHDPSLQQKVPLSDGSMVTGLDLQEIYLQAARGTLHPARHRHGPDRRGAPALGLGAGHSAPRPDERRATTLDWVAKLKLLQAYRDRDSLEWGDPRLGLIDLQYADVRPEKGLYHRLAARGRIQRLLSDEQIAAAVSQPPEDTRAYFRGMCIQHFPQEVVGASWDSVIFDLPDRRRLQRIPTREPLRGNRELTGKLFAEASFRGGFYYGVVGTQQRAPRGNISMRDTPRSSHHKEAIMATQDRKSADSRREDEEYDDEPTPEPAAAPAAQAETEGTDDLLDEIDGVLEQNAEEFVRGFVQKGGQ